jgi:hypothetical protein
MDRMDDKLDALWAEYRAAVPDPEGSPEFMPRLWQRIEKRRTEPLSVFRRLAQVCVAGALALGLIMVAIIPLYQEQPVAGTYTDALVADQSNALAVDEL